MAVDSGNRKIYSFKSVGESIEEYNQRTFRTSSEIPIGIKTPLQLGSDNSGLLKMHKKLGDQVHDNLRNLIMTQHGERLGMYDFGGNLAELAFELGNEGTDTEAIRRIGRTVSKYMPYVELSTFQTKTEHGNNEHTAKVLITIVYSVAKLNIKERGLQFVLYVAG